MTRRPARPPDDIKFARDQRATANEFEDVVWRWIRDRQVCGQKFRRQYPILPGYRRGELTMTLAPEMHDEANPVRRKIAEIAAALGAVITHDAGDDILRW